MMQTILRSPCRFVRGRDSEQAADTDEEGSVSTDGAKAAKALLEGHDGLLVEVLVLLDLAVQHVASCALDCEVDLILPELGGGLGHEVLRPSCVE